jgi:DNA-binding transcriptional LysR family regulator
VDRFRTIDSFVRVATARSFSGAAKQLGISRALVSLHITDLEKRLGVRLFNRTTRNLTLTDAGTNYLDFCQRMLAEMAERESSIAQFQKEPRGQLKVNAPKSFGSLHLADAVVNFSARYPNIQVSLILEDYSFRPYDFVDHGLDVAVRLGDLPDSSLIARKIATLQWVVCASPKYVAQHGEPKAPADLGKHTCLAHIFLDPNDRAWRLHDADHLISVKISGAFSSNSALVLRKAALAGLGIAYLPLYCIESDLNSGALRRLLSDYSPPQRPIYVVYPPAARIPERVRTFVDFLANWFGETARRKTKLTSENAADTLPGAPGPRQARLPLRHKHRLVRPAPRLPR